MYSVHSERKVRGKLENVEILDGFPMGSSRKVFKIEGASIKCIKVMGTKLASPMVTDLVLKKYHVLVAYLTELLVDDDDSGDSMREALNQIEKFRLEIKNKYRDYLKKKELEMMSTQLLLLQKEATKRYLEIRNSFVKKEEEKRSK
ncbi:MAG: hypothetical protein J6X28_05385 [Bacilli bacterium]|nr:hypothetical protein [Bacilli bacterium]